MLQCSSKRIHPKTRTPKPSKFVFTSFDRALIKSRSKSQIKTRNQSFRCRSKQSSFSTCHLEPTRKVTAGALPEAPTALRVLLIAVSKKDVMTMTVWKFFHAQFRLCHVLFRQKNVIPHTDFVVVHPSLASTTDSNSNSYYYKNDNGSSYYKNTSTGQSRYTSPSSNSGRK